MLNKAVFFDRIIVFYNDLTKAYISVFYHPSGPSLKARDQSEIDLFILLAYFTIGC